jgi:hypothetical protein
MDPYDSRSSMFEQSGGGPRTSSFPTKLRAGQTSEKFLSNSLSVTDALHIHGQMSQEKVLHHSSLAAGSQSLKDLQHSQPDVKLPYHDVYQDIGHNDAFQPRRGNPQGANISKNSKSRTQQQ